MLDQQGSKAILPPQGSAVHFPSHSPITKIAKPIQEDEETLDGAPDSDERPIGFRGVPASTFRNGFCRFADSKSGCILTSNRPQQKRTFPVQDRVPSSVVIE